MTFRSLVLLSVLVLSLSACTEESKQAETKDAPQKTYTTAFKSQVKEIAFATEMHCLEKGESPSQNFFDQITKTNENLNAEIELLQASEKSCEVQIRITSVKGEAATLTLPL